jgi:putative membrane protein
MKDTVMFKMIIALSVIVFAVIVLLYNLPQAEEVPGFVKYLPMLNACINGTCTVLLLVSYYCIFNKRINLHKKLNIATFVLSSLFLVSYILFHSFGIETKFPADNALRPVYLFILLTHIVLAAVVLPLVLVSFYFGLTNQVIKHRKITRFSFPIWLYVTSTGVIVYLMISPYYNF